MNNDAVTVSLSELQDFIVEFLATIQPPETGATVIALKGELGAGKTTFVKTLGKVLGVSEEITSPTFTILKQYETSDSDWESLLHMDAYRIDDVSELGPIGFSELLRTPKTLFCIEWPEKIAEALPENILQIKIENTSDEEVRTIHIAR